MSQIQSNLKSTFILSSRTYQKHLIGERRYTAVGSDDGVGVPQGVRHVLPARDADLAAQRAHAVVAGTPYRLAVLLEADLTDTCRILRIY